MRTMRSILKSLYGYTDQELDSLGGFGEEDIRSGYVHTYPLEVRNIRCFGGDNCVCNEVA